MFFFLWIRHPNIDCSILIKVIAVVEFFLQFVLNCRSRSTLIYQILLCSFVIRSLRINLMVCERIVDKLQN